MSLLANDKRRALRILVDIPIVVESIGQPPLRLHPNLERIYERVQTPEQDLGRRVIGAIRDLSANGAFIAGEPLPLLARVALKFTLEEYGPVEGVGWILWRRTEDCEVPREGGGTAVMPRGFGVLFEAVPLDARIAIHRRVTKTLAATSS